MTANMTNYRDHAGSWLTTIVLGAAVCGMAGCELPGTLPEDSLALKATGDDGSCPADDCGLNSAWVNGYPVDELNIAPPLSVSLAATGSSVSKLMASGLPNVAGVRVTGFLLEDGLPAQLFAEYGELYAMRSGLVFKGDQLEGSKILIDRLGTPDVIVIHEYEYAPGLDGVPWVHEYLFTYAPEEFGLTHHDPSRYFTTPVCRIAADHGRQDLTRAAILTQERYRHDDTPVHKVLPTVEDSPAVGWFNIACQGTALKKARGWGYYPDAFASSNRTTWQQRQALLKSIVNDACGDDLFFTETGTKVAWHNGQEYLSAPEEWNEDDMVVESVWDENGALCFGTARQPESDMSPAAEIAATCGELLQRPPCGDRVSVLGLLGQAGEGVIATLVVPEPE